MPAATRSRMSIRFRIRPFGRLLLVRRCHWHLCSRRIVGKAVVVQQADHFHPRHHLNSRANYHDDAHQIFPFFHCEMPPFCNVSMMMHWSSTDEFGVDGSVVQKIQRSLALKCRAKMQLSTKNERKTSSLFDGIEWCSVVQFLLDPSPFWLSASFSHERCAGLFSTFCSGFLLIYFHCSGLCVVRSEAHCLETMQSLTFLRWRILCVRSLSGGRSLWYVDVFVLVFGGSSHMLAWWGRCLCFRSTHFYFMP